MADDLRCYRCGESLVALTLPVSRRDECPSCANPVHVCRMCEFFDRSVPQQCREDDAEEVVEKERPNFCDWYKPSSNSFDSQEISQENKAKDELAALFSGVSTTDNDLDNSATAAEDLFK